MSLEPLVLFMKRTALISKKAIYPRSGRLTDFNTDGLNASVHDDAHQSTQELTSIIDTTFVFMDRVRKLDV